MNQKPEETADSDFAERAAPAVKRMESGRIAVDYRMIERRALDDRLNAFREAFLREQAAMEEDEEDIIMLAGSLH